jgi:hypothetical protein
MTTIELEPTQRTRPECSYDGCMKPAVSRGLCGAHYRRLLGSGTTELVHTPAKGKRCVCGKPVLARGLCRACYDAEAVARRPKRNLDTLCLHGGPDDRPSCPDGHVRHMLCGDETCLEAYHCNTVVEGASLPGPEFLVSRNRQLQAKLRSFDNF